MLVEPLIAAETDFCADRVDDTWVDPEIDWIRVFVPERALTTRVDPDKLPVIVGVPVAVNVAEA